MRQAAPQCRSRPFATFATRVLLHTFAVACATLWPAVAGSSAAAPKRIVSLAPHLTELAFSAGAGDRIVATVEYSDHPPAARHIVRIGDAFRVDLERLLALHPDVVLAWQSGTPLPLIERIRALGLRVVVLETQRIEDVSRVIREIGQLAGTDAQAVQAARQFDSEIRAVRRQYRNRAQLRVFLQVGDRPLYTVSGRQIMSEVLELCGGRNVFADLEEVAPLVDIEAVIAADPQAILSTDDTVPDAPAAWQRWQHIEAVRAGNVYSINSDNVARATARLAIGAREVCRTLDMARERLRGHPGTGA